MALGVVVSRGRVVGLERAARMAGEAFGYEDVAATPRWRWTALKDALSRALHLDFRWS